MIERFKIKFLNRGEKYDRYESIHFVQILTSLRERNLIWCQIQCPHDKVINSHKAVLLK